MVDYPVDYQVLEMTGYSLGKEVKFEEVILGGRKMRFPVEYNDQLRISANFTISSEKARKMLPSKRLEPIETKPDVAILSIIAYEYHKIQGLKPYNEFGTFIPVNYRRENGSLGEPGVYCLHLPVTTEMARWGGVAIYGFPKIMAEIDWEYGKNSSSCAVWHDGKTVAKLTVNKLETKIVTQKSICYTCKDGSILKSLVETEGQVGVARDPAGAKIELGDHKIAEDLKQLGISHEAFEYQYVPKMYMLLHQPSEQLAP